MSTSTPPCLRERVPQSPPVLGEQLGVARAVLLEEPRRALDVGEEEGDGAAREVAPGSRHDHLSCPSLSMRTDEDDAHT